jgi:hypothetical protein
VLNNLNHIPTMALVGTGMEVSRVFITIDCCSYFAALFPKLKLCTSDPAQNADDESLKVVLTMNKRTAFFYTVKEVNHNPAVRVLLG